MTSLNPLTAVRSAVVDRVHNWSVGSQQGARRNALVANTALAARRAERQEVDAFFATLRPDSLRPDTLRREPPAAGLPSAVRR